MTRRRQRIEEQIQSAIVDYLRWVLPGALVFAIPNKGTDNKIPGLTKGIPDLAFIASGGVTRYLEVKKPTGVLSDEQIAIGEHMCRLEADWACVTSVEDVRACLEAWDVRNREAVPLRATISGRAAA